MSIVPSLPPLAIMPSPRWARALMKSVWPSSEAVGSPVWRSWTRMIASSPALKRSARSSAMHVVSALTGPVCALILCVTPEVARLRTVREPSARPMISVGALRRLIVVSAKMPGPSAPNSAGGAAPRSSAEKLATGVPSESRHRQSVPPVPAESLVRAGQGQTGTPLNGPSAFDERWMSGPTQVIGLRPTRGSRHPV